MKQILNITMPLIIKGGMDNMLNTRLRVACNIYNDMLDYKLKRYRALTLSKEWQKSSAAIAKFYNSEKGKEYQKSKKKGKTPDELKVIYEYRKNALKEYGFTKFSFLSDVTNFTKRYRKVIPSTMAQITIAQRMWGAFNKMLYGNGKTVHFIKVQDFNSFATDGKSGCRLKKDNHGYYLLFSNSMQKAKIYKIYLKRPETIYDEIALREAEKGNLKLIHVLRKKVKDTYKYYCQLTIEMDPSLLEKIDQSGNYVHTYGSGQVGLNIWRNKVAAVSKNQIKYFDLAPDQENHLKRVSALSQKLEYIRRTNNPQNFNEDGTIKKGIIVNGRKERLSWTLPAEYQQAKKKLFEEHRKYAETLKFYQRDLVYELLEMGDEFILYDTSSFLTKKLDFDEENRLSTKEYQKKAARRRSIAHNAPSQFLSFLDSKLLLRDLKPIERVKVKDELYWYRHDLGVSDKDNLSEETIIIKGIPVNQTIYRAFLILFYDKKNQTYLQPELAENFEIFTQS